MRARALAESLDARAVVSVRGGRAAGRAAGTIGLALAGDKALEGADLLVVDDPSFEHGKAWIARARRAGVPTVSVHDDVEVHDADLVVCGAIGIDAPTTNGIVLNGVKFYLLGRGLTRAGHSQTSRLSRRAPRVLIALGGGQHVRGLARQLVDAIRSTNSDASIVVAAGFSRGSRPTLRGARWLSARNGLAAALRASDVAIVGGGVTLYEACALGIPVVGFAVVPGQHRAIRAFADRGAVIEATGEGESAIESAAEGVAELISSRRLRETLSARACRLVDGRGAARVADRIRRLMANEERHVA